jgi:hypothetical protein
MAIVAILLQAVQHILSGQHVLVFVTVQFNFLRSSYSELGAREIDSSQNMRL